MGAKIKKVLVLLRSLEGGTYTYFKSISSLNLYKNLKLKIALLQKPTNQYCHNDINYCANSINHPEFYFPSLKTLFSIIKECLWFKKILFLYKPQVIITVDTRCLLIAYLVNSYFGNRYKLIATIHNNLEQVLKAKLPSILVGVMKRIIRHSLNNTDVVVAVSEDLASNLTTSFQLRKKPEVIYYSIGKQYQKEESKAKSISNKKKHILISVGRLVNQKDFLTTIKAFALLKDEFPKLEYWIVGDGYLRPRFENYIREKKISGIKLLGWQLDVLKFYKKADLFVFASNWEGFGCVVIEAMSVGLPVIVTNTPFGLAEIIGKNNKYGLMVEMNNSEQLANCIADLLNNNSKYKKYSERAIKRSRDFYEQNSLEKYIDIINRYYST